MTDKPKRTTYNLRFVDTGEWYKGYRAYTRTNAEAMARHVADTTDRPVDVYGGEGTLRTVIYETPRAVQYRHERGVAPGTFVWRSGQ
jgi:hypothetical protein